MSSRKKFKTGQSRSVSSADATPPLDERKCSATSYTSQQTAPFFTKKKNEKHQNSNTVFS